MMPLNPIIVVEIINVCYGTISILFWEWIYFVSYGLCF